VGTVTFDTSGFFYGKNFSVAITLQIGALGNVSFVIGIFKFNLTLLEVFYLKDIFVVGGGFELNKKYGGELGETVIDFEDVCKGVS
jgi:hypothetical protein